MDNISNNSNQNNLVTYSQYFNDLNVRQFFIDFVSQLPCQFIEVDILFGKIYITLNLQNYKNKIIKNIMTLNKKISADLQSKYIIKICKNFPLNDSVKIHLLNGPTQPRIFDCRDLFQEIMGHPYHHNVSIKDIFEKINIFNQKLHEINQNYKQLQEIGKFHVGEKYYYYQLTQIFSSMTILKDISSKKSNIYVGLSQTHLFIFQAQILHYNSNLSEMRAHKSMTTIQQKNQIKQATLNPLILVSVAQLQCISNLNIKQQDKIVRIITRKYQNLKPQEPTQIKWQFKLNNPQLLIRAILKTITKFQTCSINFQPNKQQKKKKGQDIKPQTLQKVKKLIFQCDQLQQMLNTQLSQQETKFILQKINKYYQKLIQYYSARANPYYLIYVNKLNNLYHHYYLPKPPVTN